jgi:hypothetical protein
MDTFMIGARRNWFIRVLGHGTLVRRSDRIEVWSLIAAALILAVATPIVCAIGTSAYDARVHLYSVEAQHRHPLTATAVEESEPAYRPGNITYTVRAKWIAAGQQHVDVIEWSSRPEAGDQQRIWVDDSGRYASPPKTSSLAATEASVLSVAVWLGVLSVVAAALYAIRWRLDIRRFAQWDMEINKISEGGDRRNPQ